ncbi:meiosis-specific protein MEI4 [Peromyscus leucopus]|uniref:meiosis-specific protein MEI4 n=1 Tax=Peromyscus leucopus TaxID=10041 RepID=UPI001884BA2C|nr:meiosis-specific protein MEI4 [Peromyscus leucopus]
MDIQTWYLKTSKLALALAIIHSKPADRSSREYTEHLATLVTQQESKCKSKVEALEAEVLLLRQKLFLSRISSGLLKNAVLQHEPQVACEYVGIAVHRSQFQVQHYVSQSLVTLGSCSLLRKSIILLLLSEVNSFVDDLGAINQVQGNYDVTRYENIFSLFWILEQLLQQETQGDPTLHIDHSSPEIQTFLQKHDETIFQLSDAFPLFTFYLWRLGILLNSEEMETVENESFP